ncbi:extracellular solute-binding protein [Paenibacillus sp. GYB004]|uniref:extracellular solute-binding protein n=1 Tax=Paenibacillus sp. GYB004 TaxID=2994393 RepID=UPI002F96765A
MKSYMKTALTVCATTAIALSLAACGSSKPENEAGTTTPPAGSSDSSNVYAENGLPKDQKVTLKVGYFEGGMGREWFDYAVKTFQEKYPNVKLDVTSSPSIAQVVQTKMAAQDDEDMFDLYSGGIPGGIGNYVAAGKFASQEDIWDRKPADGNGKTLKELFYEGAYESVPRIAGETYSFPIAGSGSGLMFNKTLFEQKGWNQNPKTWSEFLKLCEDIKASGIIPITFPGMYPDYITNGFSVVKLFELADSKGTLPAIMDNYNNFKLPYYLAPENVERWNRVYDMGKKGYFPEGLAALNHTQSQMQVLQGKAAMVSTGTWVENEMKSSAPADFKWGYMAVPFVDSPDQAKWVQFTPGSGFSIWAAKPELNIKWSKEFVVHLWNLDVQAQIAEKGGMIPLRADYTKDPARMAKIQGVNKSFMEYVDANKVKMHSAYFNVALTDPAYQKSTKLVTETVTQIATGKKDPLPMLQEAENFMKTAIEAQKK